MQIADIIAQFDVMLANLDTWLGSAASHAQAKGFDPGVLVAARLAPDQYALDQQVQSACDAAKYAAAYLSGTTAPSHPDTERTLDELRARVQTCRAYLGSLAPGAFAEGEQRAVSPAWMQGKSIRGDRYMQRVAIPNFYFHVVTAYAILRHNGVPLGKLDFIGVTSETDPATW